jgi:hypothetical protein
LLLIVLVLSLKCKVFHNSKSVSAIHVKYIVPYTDWDSSISFFNTEYDVIHSGDLIMYTNSYKFDSSANGRLILKEDRTRYFVFQKDSAYGYLYYAHPDRSAPNGRLPVDSTLKEFSLDTNAYAKFSNLKPDSSYYDNEGNLKKIFIQRPTNENPEKYVVSFYYSKNLVGIKETFSNKMDTITGMKLFKVITRSEKIYNEKYKMTFPETEYLLEMSSIHINENDDVLDYFKRYEETSK